ncbi:FxSxx-COOH system tetratricopeptide repeat protein [Actinomadura napierensis]|uniref:DUF7779 domain-containing protein n=1 Tax=Actinomadura napierensis TaxID=267854 RepID=A0ABP5LG40_9ACTN
MNNDHRTELLPPIWGRRVPPRPPYFTGREKELEALRTRLLGSGTAGSAPTSTPQTLYGLSGVGKTAIAVEYAYRHRDEYDIVWWIEAARPELIATSFAHLGNDMLGMDMDVPITEREKAPWAVRRRLCEDRNLRWLLIFDDAASPDDVQSYLPQPAPSGGHVIITSQVRDWLGRAGATGTEINGFDAVESAEYLHRRVPQLGPTDDAAQAARRKADVSRLAQTLGHLPLAIVHAGAYLERTGMEVGPYLKEFDRSPHAAMSKKADISYKSTTVAATWSLSLQRVGQDAQRLFRLLSFFAPGRVAQELLQQRASVDGPGTLGDALSDPARFQAARDELVGFSLIRYNGARDVLSMHPVVQRLTQEQTLLDTPQEAVEYRRTVQTLLAASDPCAPDRHDYDRAYNRTLPHIMPSGALRSDAPEMRTLIINQVRRLHLRGRHTESLRLGELSLKEWEDRFGENDLLVLRLATEVAIAMRLAERHEDAFERNKRTLALADQRINDPETADLEREAAVQVGLICANSQGADLRFLGRFEEALAQDMALLPKFEQVFASSQAPTLNVHNNIAADYRRLGDFQEAQRWDEETYTLRKNDLGPTNPRTLASLDALARDLRELGEYDRALEKAKSVCREFGPLHDKRLNLDLLNAHRGLAVALRKAGKYQEAAEQGRRVVQSCRSYLRDNHRYTLIAAADQIANLRALGDLREAAELGEETLAQCKDKDKPVSSITFATQVNLAVVLRQFRSPLDAETLDREALQGITQVYGERHPFTIAARVNLASDLFVAGKVAEAQALDEQALALGKEIRPKHPATLATSANLSIDLRGAGKGDQATRLLHDTITLYNEELASDHPEVVAARSRQRINLDLEPY